MHVYVAVVSSHFRRGNRLGLSCHSAPSKLTSLFSPPVEGAFFISFCAFFFLMTSTQALCVTVTGSDMADLRRQRDAVTGADLVELRLDTVSDPDAAGALAGRRLPAIVTCRPTWEGGAFAGSEDARKRLLADALAAGADYVDVEAGAGFDDLIATTAGKRIVLSAHHFDGLPPGTRRCASPATPNGTPESRRRRRVMWPDRCRGTAARSTASPA